MISAKRNTLLNLVTNMMTLRIFHIQTIFLLEFHKVNSKRNITFYVSASSLGGGIPNNVFLLKVSSFTVTFIAL